MAQPAAAVVVVVVVVVQGFEAAPERVLWKNQDLAG